MENNGKPVQLPLDEVMITSGFNLAEHINPAEAPVSAVSWDFVRNAYNALDNQSLNQWFNGIKDEMRRIRYNEKPDEVVRQEILCYMRSVLDREKTLDMIREGIAMEDANKPKSILDEAMSDL
jgi:hypothetical protein